MEYIAVRKKNVEKNIMYESVRDCNFRAAYSDGILNALVHNFTEYYLLFHNIVLSEKKI